MTGALSMKFLQSYYGSTVKGQFNGIYGTQAQDVMKADYRVTETGELEVDKTTVCTPENFAKKTSEDTTRALHLRYANRCGQQNALADSHDAAISAFRRTRHGHGRRYR